jgi:hypothetical protein
MRDGRRVVKENAGRRHTLEIDLHRYHPHDIADGDMLDNIVQQAWQMGETKLVFIHGHGRNRGISPVFVNTNTGYLGLTVRSALRHSSGLKPWIKISTLDCSDPGTTSIELKRNPSPSRSELDPTLFPKRTYQR